jgi:hypothetical protein
MYKKLIRALKDFATSTALKAIGCKKLKIPEEDYYEEEEKEVTRS